MSDASMNKIGRPSKFTRSEQAEIVRLYLDGWTSNMLAEKCGTDRSTICRILERQNCSRRSNWESHRLHGHRLNLNAFRAPLSPEAAYWIGFLLADGYVSPGKAITLALHTRDIKHVEKFRTFMGSSARIGYTGPLARVSIHSAEVVYQLAQFNVVPQKSLTVRAPDALCDNPNFWRGVVDGDGSIYLIEPHRFRLSLAGTKTLLMQWGDFVAPYTDRPTITPIKSIYYCAIQRQEAVCNILRSLYEGAPPIARLERKFLMANRCLARQGRGGIPPCLPHSS